MQCTHYCRFLLMQTVMLNKALLLQGCTHQQKHTLMVWCLGEKKWAWLFESLKHNTVVCKVRVQKFEGVVHSLQHNLQLQSKVVRQ